MIDLRHYRYFIAVADERHFGRAAERLHMTLPPLSMQIRQLEDYIGVQLFVRGKRPIRLTAAGREFYPYARAVLQQSEVAVNRARQGAAGELGSVALGVTAAALLGPLPGLLSEFRETFPNISLEFREMVTSAQVQALENRFIHIGVMRPDTMPRAVKSRVFLTEPLVVALPKAHPLTRYERIPYTAIHHEAFINYDSTNSPYFFRLVQAFMLKHDLQPKVVLDADQLMTVISLVGTGAGIALVPKVGTNIKIQSVAFRMLDDPEPPRSELLVCHHMEEHSPVVTNLLAALK